jgi:hypothetical protein
MGLESIVVAVRDTQGNIQSVEQKVLVICRPLLRAPCHRAKASHYEDPERTHSLLTRHYFAAGTGRANFASSIEILDMDVHDTFGES